MPGILLYFQESRAAPERGEGHIMYFNNLAIQSYVLIAQKFPYIEDPKEQITHNQTHNGKYL